MTGELVRIQRDETLKLGRQLFGNGDAVGGEGYVSDLFERLTNFWKYAVPHVGAGDTLRPGGCPSPHAESRGAVGRNNGHLLPGPRLFCILQRLRKTCHKVAVPRPRRF